MAKKKSTDTLANRLTKLEIDNNKTTWLATQDKSVVDLENKLSSLVTKTYQHFEAVYYPEWNQCYKDDKLYFWDRYIELVKNKQTRRTNIKNPLIATAKDTMVSNTYDINSEIKAVPKSEIWEDAVQEYQKFANSIFFDADVSDTLRQCIDEAVLTGNSFARVGYDKRTITKEYLKNWEVQTITLEYSKPVLDYTSIYEMIFDVGAKKFNKCRWKAYRTFMWYNEAISKYEWVFNIKIDEKLKNSIISAPKPVSSKNYNKIKEIKFYEQSMMRYCENYYHEMETKWRTNFTDFTDTNIFQIDYKYNDIIEVIEYREKDICAVFFNGYRVYDWINPYPFDDDPFVQLQYEKTTGFIIARGIGQKLRGHQQNIDIISNLYSDAIKITSAPMFKWFGGKNKDKVLNYQWRGILRDDGLELDPIKLVDFNSISAALGAINKYEADADKTAWLSDYTSWGQWWWVERSYGAVAQKVQILKNRLKPITDSINKFLTEVIRKMAIMAVTYMPENFKVRIVGEDGIARFEEISTESLIHDFDIIFDNTIAATKELDFAKKLQVLQTIVPINQDPMRWNQPIADVQAIVESMVNDVSAGSDVVPTDAQRVKIAEQRVELQKKMQEVMQPAMPEGWAMTAEWMPATWWAMPTEAPTEQWRFDPGQLTWETSKIANQL